MRVTVDLEICEANAVCVGLVPDVFSLDDDDVLHISGEVPAEREERVLKAVARCPRNALTVLD